MAWILALVLLSTVMTVTVLVMNSRQADLHRKLETMQRQLTILQTTLGRLLRETGPGSTPPAAAPPQQSPAPPVQTYASFPTSAAPASFPQPAESWQVRVEPKAPGRTQQEWEALVGEKLLNRIGALALIIGAGFFLKYAFDHDWISPTIRVVIGLVVGAVLIALAHRFESRFAYFAQGLLGAGVSILYLSVYASYNFYALVPQDVATIAMLVVTAITFFESVRFESIGVALIGFMGGFLTPALLDQANAPGPSDFTGIRLFIYIFVLDLGLVGLVAVKRAWWVLEALTIFATYLTYATWLGQRTPPQSGPPLAFLTAVWLLFLAVDVKRVASPSAQSPSDAQTFFLRASGFLNGAAYYGFFIAILAQTDRDVLGLATLGVAAVYTLPLLFLGRSIPAFTLKAATLLVIATGLQFDGFLQNSLWAAEACLILAAGIWWNIAHVRWIGLGIYGVAVMGFLATGGTFGYYHEHGRFTPVLNERAGSLLLLGAAAAASAWMYRTFKSRHDLPDAGWGESVLHYLWCLAGFALVGVETFDYFDERLGGDVSQAAVGLHYKQSLAILTVWALYSLAVLLVGRTKQISEAKLAAMGFFFISALGLTVAGPNYRPIVDHQTILNLRVLSFAVVIAVAGAMYVIGKRDSPAFAQSISIGAGGAIAVLMFVLVSAESYDPFTKQIQLLRISEAGFAPIDLAQLENLRQLALSAGWLAYSIVAMIIGIARQVRWIRFVAIGIFGLTILKVFFYDLSFLRDLYRIFSFVALGLILLGVSYLYHRFRDLILGPAEADAPPPSLASTMAEP